GTSGWSYDHWKNGVFYPKNWDQHELKYYQKYFNSVELNASFYHLPKKQTFANWHKLVPEDFIFAIKASRYLTHILKLSEPREPLENLLENASELKENLGPIFFQFSPRLSAQLKTLKDFANILEKETQKLKEEKNIENLQFAFEFRHETWFNQEIYNILETHNLALIFADTPKYPLVEKITADFIYIRLHGHEILYQSKYSKEDLESWAEKILNWEKEGQDVYCYFDNDANANAVDNATELKTIIDSQLE
ncbi:MAG: DUF72 domain-containing protein, partial [Patescibacteria group bacterium]